ncbi:CLPTM1 domain protein [Myriangium duriaei CBS 260.36]|uniref:CLPTM1 domain protein n=1 Tax=Myriangium duriaei CBS 260.36 TaxID=1168546 RepID=A0A9P4MM59_9PEZI|nr:CLPTM1 domain protein [Myriangium duriaei CBS 260.36]
MPESQAPAQRPARGQAQEGQGSGWQGMARQAVQLIGLWFLMQFITKQFLPQKTPQNQAATSAATEYKPGQPGDAGTSYSQVPQTINPFWPSNASLDINLYISPSLMMPSLKVMPSESLVLRERNFKFGDYKDKRDVSVTFDVPDQVQQNGTLWAHIYVAQTGSILDPTEAGYDPTKAYRVSRPLTQYLTKKKVRQAHNLLTGKNETDHSVDRPELHGPTVASYYHPNFTLSFIPDSGTQNYPGMHPALRQFVALEATGSRDASGQNGWYYPILYLNTFWQLRSQMTILNETVKHLDLNVQINNLANWKFSVMAAMDEGMKETARKVANGETTPGGGDGSELELIKETLLDTSVWLLGTTAFVSVLHMFFEMLAFKNDVSHWRNKKDNVGTSLRTILANIVMQSIIFLYLLDQNENTSWMIMASQGMGIVIEAWKITKTVNVRIRPSPPGSLLPYRIAFEDKHKLSEVEKQTNEYDEIAFRYLYIVAVPLLIAYAVYSLYYESHKSWYSFVIQVLVGSVYAYGFLLMCPALYINYRLKSVAHMPGKAMMYKFLNTFIDDLFAFTIKMPWLYRLSVFRDDIIFFIYLYQSWKYKTDFTRVNEFGQGGDDEDTDEKKTNKPLTSPPDADTQAIETKAKEVKATGSSKGEGAKKRK